MPHRSRVLLIALVLLLAAALRLIDLTRLPPGFSNEEITSLAIAETVKGGTIASFYNVGDPFGGREGLFPTAQAIITGMLGDGFLPVRMLSLWCGLLGVALTYALGRRLFNPYVGLVAALALSVSLWPVLLSRTAVREALLLPLAAAALLLISIALHLRQRVEPDPPLTVSYAALGLMMAVMAYTHWTGLVIVPVFVLFVFYLVRTRQPISRRTVSFSIFAMLVALIGGIPYLTFTLRAHRLSGFYVFWAERPESIGSLISTTLQAIASVGVVGDPLPQHNIPGWPLVGPLALILLTAGVIEAVRRWRAPNMMLILLALIFGLATDAWTRDAPNFADLTLALPAIAVLIGVGAQFAADQVRRPAFVPAATAALAAISALLTANALFRDWAARPDVDEAYRGRLGHIAAYLDRANDSLSTSICTFNLGEQPPVPTNAAPVANSATLPAMPDPLLLEWMMHRKSADLRFSNCLTGLVLTRGGEAQRFAFAERAASANIAPTFEEWLTNIRPIAVPGLPSGAVLWLDASQAVADSFGRAILSYVEWAPETVGPSQQAALPLRMGGYLTFEGYRLEPPGPYTPGATVNLITYWRADGAQVPGLRLFAHVSRNPNAEPALQNDILSIDASRLRDRDVFIQIIALPIPADFPPGEYFLSVGAYSQTTQERLPVYDQSQERGNRLFLAKITVGQ